jgi:hypothetical protein
VPTLLRGGVIHSWAEQRSSEKRAQWWSTEKIRTDRRGFETAVKRATSSHHKVGGCTALNPKPETLNPEARDQQPPQIGGLYSC